MRGLFPTGGIALAVAGLATLFLSLPAISPTLPRPWYADELHPVAAFAWAQANCQATFSAQPSAARLPAEDLLQMSGGLDALDAKLGHAKACAVAVTHAEEVAVPDEAGRARNEVLPGPIASVR